LAAGGSDRLSEVQRSLEVLETEDEVIDGGLRRAMEEKSQIQIFFHEFRSYENSCF
jgi:hypothetical protein